MVECDFRFLSETDFMTFSLRSNGKRSVNRWQSEWVIVEGHNCAIRVCQNSWGRARIAIGDDNYYTDIDDGNHVMAIPDPRNELIYVRIIDDGQNINFECSFGGETYAIHGRLSGDGSINREMCKIAMYNRECYENVVDITMLRVSI